MSSSPLIHLTIFAFLIAVVHLEKINEAHPQVIQLRMLQIAPRNILDIDELGN